MKTLTRKSLWLAIVTALAAVGLFALASPAGAYGPYAPYAPLPPGPVAQLQPRCLNSTTLTGDPLGAFNTPTYYERYQGYEVVASGWAIDPQAGSGPIDVRVDFLPYTAPYALPLVLSRLGHEDGEPLLVEHMPPRYGARFPARLPRLVDAGGRRRLVGSLY